MSLSLEKEVSPLYDLVVIGSGILGISTAVSLLEKDPSLRVIIFGRYLFPTDREFEYILKKDQQLFTWDPEEIEGRAAYEMIEKRCNGILKLIRRIDDKISDVQYSKFTSHQQEELEKLRVEYLRVLLEPVISSFLSENMENSKISSSLVSSILTAELTNKIDTVRISQNLSSYAQKLGVKIISNAGVIKYEKHEEEIEVFLNNKNFVLPIRTKSLLICIDESTSSGDKDFENCPPVKTQYKKQMKNHLLDSPNYTKNTNDVYHLTPDMVFTEKMPHIVNLDDSIYAAIGTQGTNPSVNSEVGEVLAEKIIEATVKTSPKPNL